MTSIYTSSGSSTETPRQALGGWVAVLDQGNSGQTQITSAFLADGVTISNLSEYFVRIELAIDPSALAGTVLSNVVGGPPTTLVAPGAVYTVDFAERNIIQGVSLQTVAVNPPGSVTSPAEQLSTVQPDGVAFVLVTFIET
jgi:hypothetical protein